jgi:threonine synthase
VLLQGLADDGALYAPEAWPKFTVPQISGFRGKPYADVAFDVISAFVDGEIGDDALWAMCGLPHSIAISLL